MFLIIYCFNFILFVNFLNFSLAFVAHTLTLVCSLESHNSQRRCVLFESIADYGELEASTQRAEYSIPFFYFSF